MKLLGSLGFNCLESSHVTLRCSPLVGLLCGMHDETVYGIDCILRVHIIEFLFCHCLTYPKVIARNGSFLTRKVPH